MPLIGPVVGNTERQSRFYLSNIKHAGMKRYDEAGLDLWTYERNRADPADPLTVTATNGTRTDTVKVGMGAGGCIEEWTAADSDPGLNEQFLSTAGISRGLSANVERVEADGTEYHAHMAASKFDGAG